MLRDVLFAALERKSEKKSELYSFWY